LITDASCYLFTRESLKGSKSSKPTNVEFYFELQEVTSTSEECFIRFKGNSDHLGTPEASVLVNTTLGEPHTLFWNVNPALSSVSAPIFTKPNSREISSPKARPPSVLLIRYISACNANIALS
jgi:hypothetical protein